MKDKNKKYAHIPVTNITIEPKLFSMVIECFNTTYLKNEVAYNLEGAVKKVTLSHQGKFYTPKVNHVTLWTEISISDIKHRFKNTK